tara:strand:- start:3748 stop:4458 length:711 start_codon:yes stop_codon:yes gene_type:complete
MKTKKEIFSNESKSFVTICYEFIYKEDKDFIDKIIKKSLDLTSKMNPYLARESLTKRDESIVKANCFAGLLSEFGWKDFITRVAKKADINCSLEYGEYSFDKNQVDIVFKKDNQNKSLEVRSSFPYAGIRNSIFNHFDIIGWYKNDVKINEIRKDYYLRVLFPYKIDNFRNYIKKGFKMYLCGGADQKLLTESKFSKYKPFIPKETVSDKANTLYRVISPISNGYDCIKIVKKVLI